jgi:hypothetical protein
MEVEGFVTYSGVSSDEISRENELWGFSGCKVSTQEGAVYLGGDSVGGELVAEVLRCSCHQSSSRMHSSS